MPRRTLKPPVNIRCMSTGAILLMSLKAASSHDRRVGAVAILAELVDHMGRNHDLTVVGPHHLRN
jgi:hypothetical protein